MKISYRFLSLFLISGLIALSAWVFLTTSSSTPTLPQQTTSGAGLSLEAWASERAYPGENISPTSYVNAFQQHRTKALEKSGLTEGEWESLGPENVGGRTLCLAFHPTDSNIIYAGTAGGGLWKTETQGVGQQAWQYVPTGFPIMGVAAIAIDQNDPDHLIIGTGETYGIGFARPGTENRLTRGTYGIGILQSKDGGQSWSQVLEFNQDQIIGIQDLEYNPLNDQEVYATTSIGVYKSINGGDNWALIFNRSNCVDLEIDPTNGSTLYVTHGNLNFDLNPAQSGIYKSINGGVDWVELTHINLPTAWSGNAKLVIAPDDANTIYASLQDAFFDSNASPPRGILKSTDAGQTWANINRQDIARFQGWYSHDIAINPNNTSHIFNVGVDAWTSTNGGTNFTKRSDWAKWTFGLIDVAVPEGGDDYVHADIHGVYYHPLIPNKVFLATDGGVFSSADEGLSFTTHNGGLQTTQFYANMGSSATNPDFCIAGAQDNSTYIYRGSPSWSRVIGGDGMSAAVNQTNDQIVYGSAQGLYLVKSIDGGESFANASPVRVDGDRPAFSAPYELAPSNNNIMYAGMRNLHRSNNGGNSWSPTTSSTVDLTNYIVKIAISPTDPNVVYVATTPDPFSTPRAARLFKSSNAGQTFTPLSGLPNRVCKDISIDPNDSDVIYTAFSGFGTQHVYKSVDGGSTWGSIDGDLPDIPTNTIVIDPLNSNDIYVGNDLGVYYSPDAGASWEAFSDALPEATMVVDLNISPSNRKLRIATHGHGIFQRDFVAEPLANQTAPLAFSTWKVFPNPSTDFVEIEVNVADRIPALTLTVHNELGQQVARIYQGSATPGINSFQWHATPTLKRGTYYLRMTADGFSTTQSILLH